MTGEREPGAAFIHHACVYASDEEFLATAVPFVSDGLAAGEPVLVSVTAANLELLRGAMGARASQFDYAEAPFFGRRPPQRVAALHRWWARQAARADAPPGGRARILAESVWAGLAPAQVTAWQRLEAGLNQVLAPFPIRLLCPYDARVAAEAVVASARQTHPALVRGRAVHPRAEFADPAAFARACDDAYPLSAPPRDVPALRFTLAGEIAAVRRFVAEQAAALGLAGEPAKLLVAAAGEVATYLVQERAPGGEVRAWAPPGRIACDISAPGWRVTDPFLGYRPPALEPQPGDGLWLTRQICDAVHVRTTPSGATFRLQMRGPRAAEP